MKLLTMYYSGFVGKKVYRRGLIFDSGKKVNTVKEIIQSEEDKEELVFTFVEDDSKIKVTECTRLSTKY